MTSFLAHGEVTSGTFTGCKLGEISCTVTLEHLNYLAKGELTASDNAYELLVTEKAGSGKPQAHVVCGAFLDCKFSATTILFEGLLTETDEVFDVLQEVDWTGALCPMTHVWHAKYLTRCLEGTSLVGCWLRME